MTDKETLKPCPFCGSTSIRLMYKETLFIGYLQNSTKLHKYKVYVRCNKCFSRGKPISFEWVSETVDSREKLHEHDKEAIEAWNKRANND